MTHIVHILQHKSIIGVDRGFLTCKTPLGTEKRLPLVDILAIIIAAKGVSFSAESLSRLIQYNVIIVHCNEKYQPIGETVSLHHLVHISTFENQIKSNQYFNKKLWDKILLSKITNQAILLDLLGKKHNIYTYIKENRIDEGNISRHYWGLFFKEFGRKAPKIREHQNAEHPVNGMLNYAYAIFASILHRSILVHGLSPILGIHHKYRFRNNPLIYDLIEPLRPLADFILYTYHKENPRKEIDTFVRYASKQILSVRLSLDGKKYFSLIPVIDYYISSVANCYKLNDITKIKIPSLQGVYFEAF